MSPPVRPRGVVFPSIDLSIDQFSQLIDRSRVRAVKFALLIFKTQQRARAHYEARIRGEDHDTPRRLLVNTGVDTRRHEDAMAFDLTRLLSALPKPRMRASVDLLLAVSCMKANDLNGFKRTLESAQRRAGDEHANIVSMKFNTLSGRNLTLLSEALGTHKVEFVEALLHEFNADASVDVNGRNVIETALESPNFAQFDVLILARLRDVLKPKQSLEDFVRAVAPGAVNRFLEWQSKTSLAADTVPLGVPVVNRASVSSGTSTLPYEMHEEVSEVVTYTYEPATTSSASDANSFSPGVSEQNATTEEDIQSRNEHGALDYIVEVMQKIPGFELEVMRIEGGDESEADRMHGGALSRLLFIENALSGYMIELDGLLEADRTPELVRRYRRQANTKLAQLGQSIDELIAERLAVANGPASPSGSQS